MIDVKLNVNQIASFQKEILTWYSKNKRDLPWRHPSLKLRNGKRDPYKILVSEVMSQQTQLSRVVPKYIAWMEKFPTLKDLAEASTRDVLLYWSGLGYNRRALFLQKLAQEIVKNYKGVFPQDKVLLKKLPGIGEYTAQALLCFAFNKQVAVIDTNIKKVIVVKFFKGNVPHQKILEEIAQQLLPKGRAYEWNQALMDYASEVLKKEKIPIPKQSKFVTSKRYIRGQVIKLLLKQSLSLAQLQSYFSNHEKRQFLLEILQDLEKEGFVTQQRNKYLLT